ncbi:MAG: response regulator transcription factor [Acidobacteriota bacterium]
MTRVLVADDHALVRHGIRRIIESHGGFQVVAEAGSGLCAIEEAGRHQPGLVTLDVGMSELSGLAALAKILGRAPDARILMVTMHAHERYVYRALREGASGYVLKDSVEEDLIEALVTVRRGGCYFSPAVRGFANPVTSAERDTRPDDPYDTLTGREQQVYQLLAEGGSNKEIAGMLGLSLHTVETHRARIMEKLGLHTAAELVISAVRRGLVA